MGRVDRAVAVVLTADGPEHVPLGPPPATADLAVGDWVALDPGGRLAGVLPRRSALTRAAAGRATEPQVVAANLDTVFVVAVAAAANPRRMERAMALAWASGALPVVVLTKTDRATELEAAVDSVRQVAIGVDVLVTSAREGTGLEELKARLGRGRTAALLGPSGVGKSSLVNALA
ncbi:MAG: GTPase RsgA, partial [Acidimicrobiales bacterium]